MLYWNYIGAETSAGEVDEVWVEVMKPISEWNWGFVGVILALVVILIAVYQMIESSEAQLRTEMQLVEARLQAEMRRIEAERKADEAEWKAEMQRIEAARQADKAELRTEIAALSAKLDSFIERVDSRLDEVEKEQARLSAVNDLLAQQPQR